MRVEYFVVHNGKEFNADNFESALDKAVDLTFREEINDTALIFIREIFEPDNGDIEVHITLKALRWVIGGKFELVKLHL